MCHVGSSGMMWDRMLESIMRALVHNWPCYSPTQKSTRRQDCTEKLPQSTNSCSSPHAALDMGQLSIGPCRLDLGLFLCFLSLSLRCLGVSFDHAVGGCR